MNREELAARIDHTVLGPETTVADVHGVLEAASEHGMNACIPPCYVREAAEYAPDVTLATVVGFPHGQHAAEVKREEAVRAWDDGAGELDVVINVGRLQAGEDEAATAAGPQRAGRTADEAVREELAELTAAVPVPVKVIIETALLTDEQKRRACELAADARADMVKTSTGFADGGAEVPDVELMSEYLPVKASGGIGSWAEAERMFDAGAERIGASSGVAILEDYDETA
jgi:deoxyribose-phosphate aldolase